MAIDLGKSGDGANSNPNPNNTSSNSGGNSSNSNPGSAPGKDYNNPNSSPEVRQIYVFAYECKRKNMPDYQIEQSLMNRGLDSTEVMTVMRNVNRVHSQSQAEAQSDNGGGAKIPSGLIVVALIIIFDILSFAFDWGFILY